MSTFCFDLVCLNFGLIASVVSHGLFAHYCLSLKHDRRFSRLLRCSGTNVAAKLNQTQAEIVFGLCLDRIVSLFLRNFPRTKKKTQPLRQIEGVLYFRTTSSWLFAVANTFHHLSWIFCPGRLQVDQRDVKNLLLTVAAATETSAKMSFTSIALAVIFIIGLLITSTFRVPKSDWKRIFGRVDWTPAYGNKSFALGPHQKCDDLAPKQFYFYFFIFIFIFIFILFLFHQNVVFPGDTVRKTHN